MVVASGISFICSKIDSGNAADAGNINQVISIFLPVLTDVVPYRRSRGGWLHWVCYSCNCVTEFS